MNPKFARIAFALLSSIGLAAAAAGCGLELHEKPDEVDAVPYAADAAEGSEGKADLPRAPGTATIPPIASEVPFVGTGGLRIPDNNLTGVASRASVSSVMRVSTVRVELSIAHTYIGDLQVSLSHGSTVRVIHNHEGGSADNLTATIAVEGFEGLDAFGDWQLRIVDSSAQDVGTLVSWRLLVTPATNPSQPSAGQMFTGPSGIRIPDNNANGVTTSLAVPSNVTGRSVSVSVQVNHTYIGDLNITLAHGNERWTLHNRAGGSADSLNVTLPLWPAMAGAAAGTWTLRLVDGAAQDMGTLASWSLRVSP